MHYIGACSGYIINWECVNALNDCFNKRPDSVFFFWDLIDFDFSEMRVFCTVTTEPFLKKCSNLRAVLSLTSFVAYPPLSAEWKLIFETRSKNLKLATSFRPVIFWPNFQHSWILHFHSKTPFPKSGIFCRSVLYKNDHYQGRLQEALVCGGVYFSHVDEPSIFYPSHIFILNSAAVWFRRQMNLSFRLGFRILVILHPRIFRRARN